jgi:hypothetical protein
MPTQKLDGLFSFDGWLDGDEDGGVPVVIYLSFSTEFTL